MYKSKKTSQFPSSADRPVRQLNLYEVPYTLYAVNDGLCHVGLTASVLLTLSITVERHSAVCSATNYQTRQGADRLYRGLPLITNQGSYFEFRSENI
jgi:hypothetical protein